MSSCALRSVACSSRWLALRTTDKAARSAGSQSPRRRACIVGLLQKVLHQPSRARYRYLDAPLRDHQSEGTSRRGSINRGLMTRRGRGNERRLPLSREPELMPARSDDTRTHASKVNMCLFRREREHVAGSWRRAGGGGWRLAGRVPLVHRGVRVRHVLLRGEAACATEHTSRSVPSEARARRQTEV